MRSLCLFSPAKINLFLQIKGRRPDGFHELSSLFQTLSLGDTIDIETTNGKGLSVSCSDSTLPTDGRNLAFRAVERFWEHTGISTGIKLHLSKRIPMEAGLGGGSSNAATVLWGLNELFGRPLKLEELVDLGADLGSDVPFFFSRGSALCEGRGERLTYLSSLPPQDLLLVKPQFGLSTARVYQEFRPEDRQDLDTKEALRHFAEGNWQCWNDLEPAAFRLNPELATFKHFLSECSSGPVMMSGSGTAFFCVGQKEMEIPENCLGIPTGFLNRGVGEWYVEESAGRRTASERDTDDGSKLHSVW